MDLRIFKDVYFWPTLHFSSWFPNLEYFRRMSISNSQLASDLGWDNGWEIPVANEENKTLSSQLAAKTREKDLYSGKIMFSFPRTGPSFLVRTWSRKFYRTKWKWPIINPLLKSVGHFQPLWFYIGQFRVETFDHGRPDHRSELTRSSFFIWSWLLIWDFIWSVKLFWSCPGSFWPGLDWTENHLNLVQPGIWSVFQNLKKLRSTYQNLDRSGVSVRFCRPWSKCIKWSIQGKCQKFQNLCSAEIETVSEKCKNLKTHLKAVRDELNNNLSMRQMRQNEVNTEKVGAREHIPHH